MKAAKFVCAIVLAAAGVVTASQAFGAAATRDQALATFKKAEADFARTCTAGPDNPPPPSPEGLEEETGEALATADGVLSKGDDPDLLKALIAYIAASDCSADESRAFTLGSIFHHRPDALETAIGALPEKQRCELVNQLDWGWQNEIYGEKIDAKLKADREGRLKKLKAALPKSCSGGAQ